MSIVPNLSGDKIRHKIERYNVTGNFTVVRKLTFFESFTPGLDPTRAICDLSPYVPVNIIIIAFLPLIAVLRARGEEVDNWHGSIIGSLRYRIAGNFR